MPLTPIQQEWVDALRSGEYRQGRNYLRLLDNYCCLGVTCDLAVKHGVIPEPRIELTRPVYHYDSPELDKDHHQILPPRVRDWIGLNSPTGRFGPERQEMMTLQNDELGKTFSEIADIIEANADTLFVKTSEGRDS